MKTKQILRLFQLGPVVPLGNDENGGVSLLVDSINDSARQVSAITLTFLATVIYIAIAAGSTTDEQLLLNSPLTLPLFGVGVLATYFYFIAPAIIVFLHLNLLLHEYVIAYRMYRLPAAIRLTELASSNAVEVDNLFVAPSIIMRLKFRHNKVVRFFFRLVFAAVMVVLPVVVLIVVQVQFLPYHHLWMTKFHQGLVFLDICLVWVFFLIRPRASSGGSSKYSIRWGLEAVAAGSLSMLAILAGYVSVVASIPKSCDPATIDRYLDRNLSLLDRVLGSQDLASGEAINDSLVRGIRLTKRDLRCADLSGSSLLNADFRGSDLRGANFFDAKLSGADFSPLGMQYRRKPKAELAGVGFTSPLPEGEAEPTLLEGANFTRADLRAANFRAAHLGLAHLENADLTAADFSFANLDGARLSGAFLFAADFKSSSLRSADLQGAQLQGANLSAAKIEYAIFSNASLEGASLFHVTAEGAEFIGTSLQGAFGLPLQGIDLRQAKLARVSFCGKPRMRYADLRDVDLLDRPWFDLKAQVKGLSSIASDALARFEEAKKSTPCLGESPRPQSLDHILYSRRQLQDWPMSELDENSYHEMLADYLMEHSCSSDESVRLAMERRMLERLSIDPEDALAKKIVRLLRQEILSPQCNFSFEGHEDIKRKILRRVDLSQ